MKKEPHNEPDDSSLSLVLSLKTSIMIFRYGLSLKKRKKNKRDGESDAQLNCGHPACHYDERPTIIGERKRRRGKR